MIGYIKPDFKKMTYEQKKEYKSFYCGLCKSLKKEYGYIGISSLNYEITSFLLLLQALKEEKHSAFGGSCTISPFVPVSYIDYHDELMLYASCISVLISYFKIKDNLTDEGGFSWGIAKKIFDSKIAKSSNILKFNYFIIEKHLNNYYSIENDSSSQFYSLIQANGDLIESIFAPLIDFNDNEIAALLSKLTNLLGQWIYLIDACDDYSQDIKKNRFNPILRLDNKGNIQAIIESIETQIFEIIIKLPLKKYKEIVEFIYIENLREVSRSVLMCYKRTSQI